MSRLVRAYVDRLLARLCPVPSTLLEQRRAAWGRSALSKAEWR